MPDDELDHRHPAHAVLVQALAPRLTPEQTALRGGAEHLAHEAVIALNAAGLLLSVADEPILKHAGTTLGEVEAWARGVKDALGKGWSYREDLGEATKFRDGFESAIDALSSHLDDMKDAR